MIQTKPIEFIEHFDSLIISSLDSDYKPNSSYAPFVTDGKNYYVSLSQTAKHTKNLLGSKEASIMFIEDESETKNSFARKRVIFDVNVTHIKRDDDKFSLIINLFKDKFGEKASIYEQMSDFYLFEFKPTKGRAIFGFSQTFDYIDGEFI
jgi:putative heme iron utilization protein